MLMLWNLTPIWKQCQLRSIFCGLYEMFAQNDITKRCQTWALISKPVTIHKIFFQIISRKNNHVLAWYVSKNETLKIWANIAFTAHVSGRFLIRFLIDISQSKHWCGKLRQNEYWQVNHPLELHQTGDLT